MSYVFRSDSEDARAFARQVVLAMIQSGQIRLPSIDMEHDGEDNVLGKVSKAVGLCYFAADFAADYVSERAETPLDVRTGRGS